MLVPANPRVQTLDGRISSRGLQFYRITGLTRGATLNIHAEVTSGHLDPLVALLKPGAGPEAVPNAESSKLVAASVSSRPVAARSPEASA